MIKIRRLGADLSTSLRKCGWTLPIISKKYLLIRLIPRTISQQEQNKMVRINLNCREISTNLHGFSSLLKLYHDLLLCSDSICEIDMSRISWIDANMCAPLGALLWSYFHSQEGWRKETRILNMNREIENIFEKNGFLSDMCHDCIKKPDMFKTVIEYRRFENCESSLFMEYVENHFFEKHIDSHIPEMEEPLKKNFRRSIFEIYENAVFHSQTRLGIFACGQYFPKKELLNFTIVDLGIGIRENLYQKLKLNYTSARAISWALDGMNTTRQLTGGTPGGLGLKLIKDFICNNRGQIIIISDSGYWSYKDGKEYMSELVLAFPGTVVNVTINTKGCADSNPLSSAIPENIF